MIPEQALGAARVAAATQRDSGAYDDDLRWLTINPTHERVTSDLLMEWAVIEPDLGLVASTRRWGAPITAAKRVIMHVLRQYLAQIESQQTRFNVHILARVVEQDERLSIVEDWLRDETPTPAPSPGRLGVSRQRVLRDLPAGPARPREEWLVARGPDDASARSVIGPMPSRADLADGHDSPVAPPSPPGTA